MDAPGILTHCLACAAPLAHDAPRCVRCKSRYCNSTYAQSIYEDDGATLRDLRKAVTTLEEARRISRRVLGGANPTTTGIENALRDAREKLGARETPPPPISS